MTSTAHEAVRESRDGDTVNRLPNGRSVRAADLDAIERRYEQAKACIAEATDWPADETTEDWPETEAIDVRAIKPPTVSRMPIPASDPACSSAEAEAPHDPLTTDRVAVAQRPWRRWWSARIRESAPRS